MHVHRRAQLHSQAEQIDIPKHDQHMYIMYAYSENATWIRLHRTNVLGNNMTNILQEKGKVFSSPAGFVERSPSILAPDIWITVSLSHQISHYIQTTIPAASDTPICIVCMPTL